MYKTIFLYFTLTIALYSVSVAQSIDTVAQSEDSVSFSGLEFRAIGPAFTSGRIADIAIHPKNENIWYVAVGSGGVWKTENSGTTWKPIFDDQDSYSIGSIAIDPSNYNTIWVGTGENVGGRHVGFGDGIYVSNDGGNTWKNKGLKNSEHLSTIIIHPEDSDIVWVAAQGPLWSKGGERGLYKTIDEGENWNRVLGDSVWTGATDIVIDPRDPDVLYAATWDRHRTVAAYLGGGPGSGIHKSTDGGETWVKLTNGIPKSNLGKIGLAISPFDPDRIYAAIELDRLKGGVFMSEDQGASWTKQSDAVSGGTGPHYYQELFASPHKEGTLYLMSNYVLVSNDHFKTYHRLNETNKHVDSHAMGFKKSDPNFIVFGTDGGLYITYDDTKSWKYVSNLPVTQYYKLAVDDSWPFYKIYGGTQDNGSHGGVSQTRSTGGITNDDWWVTLGADGHQSAVEPGNPDITYGEFQQGRLWRIDQTTGETVFIQPQPSEGDTYERFNWDAPILVSPHDPTRLYFASQRVWRSDNRGDEWRPISEDLTRDQERIALPIMGRIQSWDNPWDVNAMSNYNTVTSLAESPLQEGLIYAGTDDGLLQVTEDGGESWRKLELGSLNGVPATAFVNDVRADLFDANTVYLALDNHKYGDFKPYLLKSTDRGRTWASINGNLPERLLTWRLVQDHVDKDLLFAATEFGVYFTKDAGSKWTELKGGIPTIAIRDITLQRREDDLVAASFGRGFFILDDINPIREFKPEMTSAELTFYPIDTAYLYVRKQARYAQGDNEYRAPNPPFGAVFTYYMEDKIKTIKEERQEREKELTKQDNNIPFPGWESLEEEMRELQPGIIITIKDDQGNIVHTLQGTNKKGFNRVNWELNHANRMGVPLDPPTNRDNWYSTNVLVTPGTYTATISKFIDGEVTDLAGPQEFQVLPLDEGALPGKSAQEKDEFREEYYSFRRDLMATTKVLEKSMKETEAMRLGLRTATRPTHELNEKLYELRNHLLDIEKQLEGDELKNEIGERSEPTPGDANFIGIIALRTMYGPTENHRGAIQRADKQLADIKVELKRIVETDIPQLREELQAAGVFYIEGQGLIEED